MRYRCTRKQNGDGSHTKPCGQRVKLRKPIDQYKKRPMCPACKHDSLKIDLAHYKRKRRLKCNCQGVPFPHERGTIIGCQHYARPVTEDEYRAHLDRLSDYYHQQPSM
jgi:hypothetical protein